MQAPQEPLDTPNAPQRLAKPLDTEGLDLESVLLSVRKYWTTAVAIAAAVTLGTAFYAVGLVKIYQASCTLQFDPNPPRPLGSKVDMVVDMGSGNYWNVREYYETQFRVIQSMRVATGAVRALDLNHDAGFLRNTPRGKVAPPASATVEEAAGALRGRLSVEPIKDSRLALVKLEDADPQRAARVLAAVADAYVEQNLSEALDSTTAAVEWLRGQLDTLKRDLDSSEMALHTYKSEKNILSVAFDDQSNMLRDEVRQLSEALTAVRAKEQELRARSDLLSRVAAEDAQHVGAAELLGSGMLNMQRERLQDALRDRDALLATGKGTEHPDVRAVDARATAARTAIAEEIRNIQRSVEGDLASIRRQESGLSGMLEKAKSQALDLNLLEIEYNRLRRTKENTEHLYQFVLERTKESELARMLRVNNVRVLDPPMVPTSPVRPRVSLMLTVGSLVGAALGLLVAIGRGRIDRSIKTPEDVERALGTTPLGLLPHTAPASKSDRSSRRRRRPLKEAPLTGRPELLVHDQPASAIAEAARSLRTNLMFTAVDKPLRTVLVTSAAPADGKTTVACCIAVAMAQAGLRVVIVDCDLRRPRVHRIFDRTLDSGVTTLTVGADTIDEAKMRTVVPNLSVLPSGPLPPDPSEIFHSERFKALLRDLAERYDRVILDSPPIVAVTDAAVISTLVDATILVVRAFVTRRDLAVHCIRALRAVNAKVVGSVLNAVDFSRHEYSGYYYYYYRPQQYSPILNTDTGTADAPGADA